MTQEAKYTMKLQVVMLPVSDIDRAIEFYRDKVGFHLDHDVNNNGMRIVQLTPHGSGCSIVIGSGMDELEQMQAGSIRGLHLVLDDIVGVVKHLNDKGIETGDLIEYPGGIKMSFFADPDGNTWALQELSKAQ